MATSFLNVNSVKVLMFGKVTSSDLQRYFSQFGHVSHIQQTYFIPTTSHSHGTVVTFTSSAAASLACSIKDRQVEGFRIQVHRDTNPSSEQSFDSSVNDSTTVYGTVKVSMFNGQLSEADLRSLFGSYGVLLSQPKVIPGTPTYSYIEFGDPNAAKKACTAVHMQRHNGVLIKARVCESRNCYISRSSIPCALPIQVDVCANPASWNWLSSSQDVELVDVVRSGTEWNEVAKLFQGTMPPTTCTLLSIQRIMNNTIYDEYKHRKEIMGKKSKSLNEKLLFHGSATTLPQTIYKSDVGFDFRHSRRGLWGRGAYFAENSQYSDQYSFKKTGLAGDHHRQIFLAAVLTGETCKLMLADQDQSLVEAPCKPGSTERYDSVNACHIAGSDIFVVYKLDMAYPTHLISYKTMPGH